MAYTLYNSHSGALTWSHVIGKVKFELKMAKSNFPGIKPNEIQKGMKVYDWENAMYFSLNAEEAVELWLFLNGQITLKDNKYHKIHKQGQVNNFLDVNFDQNQTLWINFSNSAGSKLSSSLKFAQRILFIKQLEFFVMSCSYASDYFRYIDFLEYKSKQKNNGGGYNNYVINNTTGKSGGNYNNSTQSNNVQQPATPPPPPPGNNGQPANSTNQTPPPILSSQSQPNGNASGQSSSAPATNTQQTGTDNNWFQGQPTF